MTDRTTRSELTFAHPFCLAAFSTPLAAGTYRLTVIEELIEGLSFAAYKKVDARLEIPSVETLGGKRQSLQVTVGEVEAAHLRDAHDSLAP